jgi:Tol biopolymer transport system component
MRIRTGAVILCAALSGGVNGMAQTTRVSVGPAGIEADDESEAAAVSADGRYVAFRSLATNLAAGDTNASYDVFVHDHQTAAIERVSLDSAGAEGNGDSGRPGISGDGRYVAFRSIASNLVPGDTNGVADVFVHDRQTGATERVSVDSAGLQANGPSGSPGDSPSVSADGRYVAFWSDATDLVASDTNGSADVFVRDRQAGTTERVSVGSSGVEGNGDSIDAAISADGRHVAFSSLATNLVAGDLGFSDVFVHDRLAGTTERVSVSSSGVKGNGPSESPALSADGRWVAFESWAGNLVPGDTSPGFVDIFVHDRQTGTTECVSLDPQGNVVNGDSMSAQVSGDGRYVAFSSLASKLVPGAANGSWNIYVRDRVLGVTEIASTGVSGPSNGASWISPISADGRYVAFESFASNLVPGDTNLVWDVFLHDRGCGTGSLNYCTAGTSAGGCVAAISSTGAASSTAPSGFVVTASGAAGQNDGMFFFSQNGRQANPWGNGTSYQCVVPPVHRGGLLSGSGTPGLCDQVTSQDLNSLWCSSCPKPGHEPAPGKIQIQFWYWDPSSTSNQATSLSDALEVDVCP